MERRMLLAVVLSFAAVMLYASVTGKCQPRPTPEEPPKEETPENPTEPGAPLEPGGPGPAAEPGPGEPQPVPAQPVPPVAAAPDVDVGEILRKTVETPELEVGFSNRGGVVEWVRLKNAYEPDKTTRLDVVVPVANDFLLGHVDDSALMPKYGAPGDANREEDPVGSLRKVRWTLVADASDASKVVYETAWKTGTLRKTWLLPTEAGRYDIRLRLSFTPNAGVKAEPFPVKILVTTGLLRAPGTGAMYTQENTMLSRLAMQSSPEDARFGVPVPPPEQNPDDLRMLGARTAYFMSAYYQGAEKASQPDVVRWWGTGEVASQRPAMEEHIASYFFETRERDWQEDSELATRIKVGVAEMNFAWLVVNVPAEGEAEIPIYVGPVARDVLGSDAYDAQLGSVITYRAAPDILADALLAIYDFFFSLLGSAGVAVVLMTLVVRGLMMPLSIKNQLSMRGYSRKIAKVKPKLDALKQKFGTNPKKMREEQGKLYREHGIGFPSGCLLLFVQMPIFFALFSSLRIEYSLRNEIFLWIQDLSGPDKLIDFGSTILDIGILQIFSLNILPLVMVILSVWQQRMMPKPADEQQAQQMRMMKWLPIVFAVILYNYTAALALYMVLSSAVGIAESRIVRWKDKDATSGPATEWPKKSAAATP